MDEIMNNNIKLLNDSKFDKDYYRNKYVEAINKIATMTGTIVDLQQQLIDLQAKLINRQNDKDWLKEDIAAKDRQIKRLKGLKIKE
jgi:uncharacterized protein (UPF0305 family)